MKTNSKQVKELIKKHILECITDANENNFETFADAKEYIKKEFDRVANYPNNIKHYPNEQARFSDYLCGLPFNFEYTFFDIAEYLNNLGINPENEEFSSAKSLHLYHYLIYKEIF